MPALLISAVVLVLYSRYEIGADSIKCGTPEILMLLESGAGKIAGRPTVGTTFGTSVLSSTGHLRVHYDTTGYNMPDMTDLNKNSIPDYIDSTLVYFEYAWSLAVDTLGYDQPLPDNGAGGGDEIDVYVRNFGGSFYGITYPEQSGDGTTAYCVIDNDYAESQYTTKGYAALRVTTAHEFFHTIHFRYKNDDEISWWMEQSAVWMEDRAWDDVNDYILYLKYYFGDINNPTTYPNNSKIVPLDTKGGNYQYGASVWAIFLAKRFGDSQIRIIWEELRNSQSPSISDFNKAILGHTGGAAGLVDALGEFGVWNYFTGKRANTSDFYHDGDLFNVTMDSDLFWTYSPAADSLGIRNLTSRYIELLFVGDWEENDILNVAVISQISSSQKSTVLFFNDSHDYEINTLSTSEAQILLSEHWDRAVLITTCTNTNSSFYQYTFEAEMKKPSEVDSQPLYTFALKKPYPNPFNPSTTISFNLPQSGMVTVRAYNAQGQKVADIFDGNLSSGEKRILWKPLNLGGGVYFITVNTPHEVKTEKVLLLK